MSSSSSGFASCSMAIDSATSAAAMPAPRQPAQANAVPDMAAPMAPAQVARQPMHRERIAEAREDTFLFSSEKVRRVEKPELPAPASATASSRIG
ncbi:MAG: hypothetical protein IPM01_30295 [Burkholderiaceae bacterium]|nr:hypothetical protein [Burkholderiaceae bacterium]